MAHHFCTGTLRKYVIYSQRGCFGSFALEMMLGKQMSIVCPLEKFGFVYFLNSLLNNSKLFVVIPSSYTVRRSRIVQSSLSMKLSESSLPFVMVDAITSFLDLLQTNFIPHGFLSSLLYLLQDNCFFSLFNAVLNDFQTFSWCRVYRMHLGRPVNSK